LLFPFIHVRNRGDEVERLCGRDPGHGDYTQERRELFADLELDNLIASIRQQEAESGGDR
jgi:hypothetical protein